MARAIGATLRSPLMIRSHFDRSSMDDRYPAIELTSSGAVSNVNPSGTENRCKFTVTTPAIAGSTNAARNALYPPEQIPNDTTLS